MSMTTEVRGRGSASTCGFAACGKSSRRFGFRSKPLHALLLIIGAVFLLLNCFHGNIWFDESYSVGIARFSFSEIWSISANDVHPVLFYWCLHVLYLVFGDSILVYRLFSIAGMVALAALGISHVRRDFGWRVGALFTFLVCFTPYIAIEGTQIRMYSWASFCVMVCFLYACRIARISNGRAKWKEGNGEECLAGRIPIHWWAVFFLSSLASAYLHYFAAMAAFLINLFLFVFLFFHVRENIRSILVLFLGALCQVFLYAPWLTEVARQMAVVGGAYWAQFSFPLTFVELGTYPFVTAPISFAAKGSNGIALQVVVCGALALLSLAALAVIGRLVAQVVRGRRSGADDSPAHAFRMWLRKEYAAVALAGVCVYLGVFAIGWTASMVMGSLIVYYRYLVVAIGPLLLAVALAVSRVDRKAIVAFVCVMVLIVSVLNQALLVQDSYSSENDAPLTYFEDAYAQAAAFNGGGDPLVLSADIGVQGVLAVTYPDIAETYLDWQPGNWGEAYRAYSPALSSITSWGEVLDGFHGAFVVVGQTETLAVPRDISDIQRQWGAEIVEQRAFYRPYERTWFTIAVMRMS